MYGYVPYYGYGYGFDPTYILVVLGAILTMAASFHIRNTYGKYSTIGNRANLTGAQTAAMILRYHGITDVGIEHIGGSLTDHYDPRSKKVRLSDAVYNSTSVAALGVAAHECGHVIQHHTDYAPLKIRTALVPLANIGSRLGMPIILIGAIIGSFEVLVPIGILVFCMAVLFQVATLPVEFNASSRALNILENTGIMARDEVGMARKVLGAAALTYVAAAAASLMTLLRLVLVFGGNNRRRR